MEKAKSCIAYLLVFAAGLAIGLIVLGWRVWPVQWQGGSMEVVDSALQQDYLRAAIDSYSINGDQNLASNRYNNVGSAKESALAAIQADPGSQSPQSVLNYSVVVTGGTGVLVTPAAAAPPTDMVAGSARRLVADPQIGALVFLGLLLVAVLIAIFFIARRGRKADAAAAAEVSPVPPADETGALVQETDLPVQEADHLEEAPPASADEDGSSLGGLAAVGLAGAAIGAAVSGDEEPAEAEAAVRSEEVSLDAAPVAEAAGGMGLAGAAALAGAAVVGAAMVAGGDEEPADDTAVPEDAAVPEEAAALPADWEPEPDLPLGGLAAAGIAAAGVAAIAASDPEEEAAAVMPPADAGQDEWQAEQAPAADAETNMADEISRLYYRDVIYVEGIGPVYGQKLKEAGVRTPGDLLQTGATPKGRQDLAEKTGISHKLILEWVNNVDLFRIKGIGQEYADLLEAAGVDTVPELAQRNPVNLFQKLVEVNTERSLVRKLPVQAQVDSWVAQAKSLPRIVTY